MTGSNLLILGVIVLFVIAFVITSWQFKDIKCK